MVRCHAKLNLFLKILGKRPDGYHDLISIMQSIDLSDIIRLEETQTNAIEITCSNPNVPLDHTNIAWKAAETLTKVTHKPSRGIKISIEKGIPLMGGLAGGSANGAGTLRALQKLWNLPIDEKTLIDLAAQIGSDVPFCLIGGTALVRGKGEIVEPLPTGLADLSVRGGAFLLVIPPVKVNTKEAYDSLDLYRQAENIEPDESIDPLLLMQTWQKAIFEGTIVELLHNDFEPVVLRNYPILSDIHKNLRNTAGHALISGSGSTIFAWFPTVNDALAAQNAYTPVANEATLISLPVSKGIELD